MTTTGLPRASSSHRQAFPSFRRRCCRCCCCCCSRVLYRRNKEQITHNQLRRRRRYYYPKAHPERETKEEEEEEEEERDDVVRINERFHWSKKLSNSDEDTITRDDLRMMPKEYFNKKNNNTNTNIQEVHRDRDTSVLVTDEQLQREFFRDNRDREIESEEDGEYSKMKERLLLLLPSLRTTTNANNNKRLVEDLLFRVGLERVSSRLLSMRKIFPTCDVAEMASKNPKVYLNFSSSNSSSDSKIERGAEEDKREDAKIEREWRMEIDTLEDMFPFAGQNGLPNVQRMVQAVPQMLDSRFVQRSIQALISSKLAEDELDAKTKLHKNPRLILNVESSSNRSRFESASHFDQTNVKRNKVVFHDSKVRETYYDTS